MLNIERYKEEIVQSFFKKLGPCKCDMSYGDMVYEVLSDIYVRYTNDRSYTFEPMMDWLCAEYKEPILTDKEKEYLSAVIRPFRNQIVSICKHYYVSEEELTINGTMRFPSFKTGTMYKGMQINKEYSLEELGL